MLIALACCSAFDETIKALEIASTAVNSLKDYKPEDIEKGVVYEAFKAARQKIEYCFTKFNVIRLYFLPCVSDDSKTRWRKSGQNMKKPSKRQSRMTRRA
jgi:hypothetical protein